MPEVLKLDDLAGRDLLDCGHAKPARLAVIGQPVAHSASPAMQQAALDLRGIAARYVRIEVEPGRVAECFARMRELGFVGCNVTVPHKFEALAACDHVEPAAADLGAVNTVRFDADGSHGANTDGPGFVRAIREEFSVDVRDLRVLILGAGGGVGSAIATQCAREGCEELVLVNRTFDKLAPLAKKLAPRFRSDRLSGPHDRLRALALTDPRLRESVAGCDLIVNCSSLGLRHGDPSPLPEGCIEAHHLVHDTIYQPPRTALLRAAAQAGARVANGASMLLHQGALAFEVWFGSDAPLAAMRAGLKTSLG